MSDPEAQSTEKYPGLHKLVMRALVAGSENGTVTDAYEKAEAFIEAHDASRQADLLAAVGENDSPSFEEDSAWRLAQEQMDQLRAELRQAINEVYGDKSWTPETFEEQLEKHKREAVTLFHNDHADGDAAIYRLCAAILAVHPTALEAAKREARDEVKTWLVQTFEKQGPPWATEAARIHYEATRDLLFAHIDGLSHPNQPKQEGGEE